MNAEKIFVSLIVPKAIGKSGDVWVPMDSCVLEVIKSQKDSAGIEKILFNGDEFNKFALVYLNGQRIKDPKTPLTFSRNTIEVVVPMAGG